MLRVWDTGKGKEILSIKAEFGAGKFSPLGFKPDGTQIAVAAERSVNIYFTTQRSTSVPSPGLPTGQPSSLSSFSEDVTALAYNQRGDQLAAGSRDGSVTVWSAEDRRQLFTFTGDRSVTSIAFSPDSSRILTTDADGSARVWSTMGNSALLTVGPGRYLLVVSHYRSRLGVYGGADNVVHIVDPESGNELRVPQSTQPVRVALDGISGRVATATAQGDITLYEASGQVVRAWPGPLRVLSLAVSPGGGTLAVSAPSGLSIWPVSGIQKTMADSAGGQDITFSPDGKKVVGTSDKAVTSWDVASGHVLRVVPAAGKMSLPVFSADGQRISAQTVTKQIRIWTADLDNEIGTLAASRTGPSTSSSGLDVSADLRSVVTVNAADGVTLSDTTARVLTNLLAAKFGSTEAVFLKDGRIAVLTKDGVLYALPVRPADTMRAALSGLIRAWSPNECEDHMPVESSSCRTTATPLQRVAEGNRIARAGDVEGARTLYVSAIRADPWLGSFVDPSRQAVQQAAMNAALSKRQRRSGLIAQGESLVGLAAAVQAEEEDKKSADAIRGAAVSYFEEAGDTEADAGERAKALHALAAKQWQVLENAGRFLASRNIDDDADKIAVAYLQRAKRLNDSLPWEPQREVELLVAKSRIQRAQRSIRIDPHSTLQAYLQVQEPFPELITGSLWNDLCWKGSLYAALAGDQREKAGLISRACDEAVKAAPSDARFADSRGLNRLLVGKLDEASKDFQAYISMKGVDDDRRKLRIRWIEEIEAHPDQNPLTAQDVAQLRRWTGLVDE